MSIEHDVTPPLSRVRPAVTRLRPLRMQADIAARYGVQVQPGDDASLDESWGRWPPFPDSVAALAYLRQHFRLVALTNAGTGSQGGDLQPVSPYVRL